MMLMIKTRYTCNISSPLNIANPPSTNFPASSNLLICNLTQTQAFPSLRSCPRLPNYDKKHTTWDFAVYSGVDPAGLPPSGPPNILSWVVGLAIAVVVPFVSYKWGPNLKNKILAALQVTEDVVEAVEKMAEEVEKVAEDISDNLPAAGKFKQAVDYVENFAGRVAKDAGAVDDFIDKVQEQEEKAESLVESVTDEIDGPDAKKSNGEDSKDQDVKK